MPLDPCFSEDLLPILAALRQDMTTFGDMDIAHPKHGGWVGVTTRRRVQRVAGVFSPSPACSLRVVVIPLSAPTACPERLFSVAVNLVLGAGELGYLLHRDTLRTGGKPKKKKAKMAADKRNRVGVFYNLDRYLTKPDASVPKAEKRAEASQATRPSLAHDPIAAFDYDTLYGSVCSDREVDLDSDWEDGLWTESVSSAHWSPWPVEACFSSSCLWAHPWCVCLHAGMYPPKKEDSGEESEGSRGPGPLFDHDKVLEIMALFAGPYHLRWHSHQSLPRHSKSLLVGARITQDPALGHARASPSRSFSLSRIPSMLSTLSMLPCYSQYSLSLG